MRRPEQEQHRQLPTLQTTVTRLPQRIPALLALGGSIMAGMELVLEMIGYDRPKPRDDAREDQDEI